MNDRNEPTPTPSGRPESSREDALRRDLTDRERQLRDLTEQALSFLEELAESRRLVADRDQLARRIGELEGLLAETRQRLRHAGGRAALAGEPARAALAIVCCGGATHADAAATAALCPELPVTWIGAPDAQPADAGPGRLQVLVHRDAHTLAQGVNLGMCGTDAEVVLFLCAGHRLTAPPVLPPLAMDLAVLAPRFAIGDADAIGCDDSDGLLHLRPRRLPAGAEATGNAALPSPHAFLLRRAAFEQLGMLDEGFGGGAAIVDYALRALRQNFAVRGAPEVRVTGPTPAPTPLLADHERLLLLAAHRPDQLGRALAGIDEPWRLGPGELPRWLAALLARLPTTDGLAAQRAVLEQVILGLAGAALPAHRVCALLRDLQVSMLQALVAESHVLHHDELQAALQRARVQAVEDPPIAVAALANDLELVRRCALEAAGSLQTTRAELQQIDGDRHAHSARAERAEGARAATQTQLEQVETWLREAQADLRRIHANQQDLQAAHDAALHRAQHAEAERTLLEQRLAEQERALAARTEGLQQATARRDVEHEVHTAQLATLAGAAGVPALTTPAELCRHVAGLVHDNASLRTELATTQLRLSAAEHSIAGLLRELQRRRLFPRPLTPSEQALLDRLGHES